MKNRLAQEFSIDEINSISFHADRQRLKKLGIRLLPAWLLNDEVLRIHPMDYDGLRQKIIESEAPGPGTERSLMKFVMKLLACAVRQRIVQQRPKQQNLNYDRL